MIDYSIMREKANLHGISLSDDQIQMLDQYAEMLVDWNTRINLTGITDSDGIMTRHFEDSLSLLQYVNLSEGGSLIDIGTGAGFPGMVLKIIRPDLKVTLLDSLNKRINFLNAVASELGLSISCIHLRAEEGGRVPQHREKYDAACARAVSNLRELSEYCIPYVKIGGQFISMKGPDISEELNAARPGIGILGGKVRSVDEYAISDGSRRTIVCVDKVKSTLLQYPRASAKIQKKPL